MNQWEEEDRRRQGEMFTLVHLRQRRCQAADQAGPEQTRSKLFGYQPDSVGCHLILPEQKPAERRPWRVRNVRRNCVWSRNVRRNCVVRRGLEESCARLAGKGWPQLARTAEQVREALRGLGGSVEVETYRGTAIE